MQDAYVTDQNAKGDWSKIGYTAPTSKNLAYTETSDWTAEPKDSWSPTCEKSTTWNVKVNADFSYTASDNCANLTPNFKNIGTAN